MRRCEAIARIIASLDDELIVTANGWISREACVAGDRPGNFYMLGSMGLAAPIGLGLALAQPGRRIIVLDGDGNLLMALGVLAMIGDARPGNLVHVVLDNELYGSTGGQRSLSAKVALDELARTAGYARVVRVTEARELDMALDAAAGAGPVFMLVKVAKEAGGTAPRVPHEPEEIAIRFRAVQGIAVEVR
ncbi:MAG: putative phosphonopyruvate decarboxylase or sulfopyruvate decarboxylase, beta subunit [Acidobacteria bacterium]|nr:putative phosphonopyruvate decarboxylase or sulfopyruvate decarboxylase, beta subunit [Acidobacteriota bacterium]